MIIYVQNPKDSTTIKKKRKDTVRTKTYSVRLQDIKSTNKNQWPFYILTTNYPKEYF